MGEGADKDELVQRLGLALPRRWFTALPMPVGNKSWCPSWTGASAPLRVTSSTFLPPASLACGSMISTVSSEGRCRTIGECYAQAAEAAVRSAQSAGNARAEANGSGSNLVRDAGTVDDHVEGSGSDSPCSACPSTRGWESFRAAASESASWRRSCEDLRGGRGVHDDME